MNPMWAVWALGAFLAVGFWVKLTQTRRAGLKKLLSDFVERRKRENIENAQSQHQSQQLLDDTQDLAADARIAAGRTE